MTVRTWEHQYLYILQELVNKSDKIDPDRTGTGRIRLFGQDIRVDLSEGILPCVTTRKINFNHAINEMLWMVSGSHHLRDLAVDTQVIWKDWAVKASDAEAFIDKFMNDEALFKQASEDELAIRDKARDLVKKNLTEEYQDSIGPMYGYLWRHTPNSNETSLVPEGHLDVNDIPSDKLKRYREQWEEMRFFDQSAMAADENSESRLPTFEAYATGCYVNNYDQLGEIVRLIKRQPYSGRHCLSVWNPAFLPMERSLSPVENVLIGKGALAPCHVFVQFFVDKAHDGGKDSLSLRIIQRSCDMSLGVPTNINFYATLLIAVAYATDLKVNELIWSGGDVHLYSNHVAGVVEQLKRTPYPAPTIKIREGAPKDLFALKRDDFIVEDYQHHPVIRFQVSV